MTLNVREWRECMVEDIAAPIKNALVGGPFGSNLVSRDYVSLGVPVIRGQNMSGRWVEGDFAFVSEKKAVQLSSNTARPGDLIFTQRGTLGQVAIVPQQPFDRYIVSQSQMKLTVDSQQADPLFLYYFFNSEEQQDYVRRNAVQTGVPHTNLEHLRRTPLLLPPLPEQRTIAAVLGALDDKIEINRHMNQTLEQMAQALFKSWFVDFDPVHANRNGEAMPGIAREVQALFPDAFEDSALGEIPQGWQVGTLGEVMQNQRRGVEPSDIDPDTPYIGLEHMPRRSIALAEWGVAGEVGSTKLQFLEGEILFGKLRPYFHKVGVAPLTGVASSDIAVISADKRWFGFVLAHVSSEAFIEYTNAVSTGTKMPRAGWADMAKYQIVIPSEIVARKFSDLLLPSIQRIRTNIMESRTLATTRDALLPKLLSGEVRVREAEKMIEEIL